MTESRDHSLYSSSMIESALLIAYIGSLSFIPIFENRFSFYIIGILVVLTIIAFLKQYFALLLISIPFISVSVLNAVTRIDHIWPLPLLLPILIYFSLSRYLHAHNLFHWLRWGMLSRFIVIFSLLTVIGASISLVLWYRFSNISVDDIRRQFPAGSFLFILSTAAGFALINSIIEEFLFRGIVFEILETTWTRFHFPVIAQSLFFGIMHYKGFPRGLSGMIMAAAYGLALGIIKKKSGGIGIPVIVHFFADFTIAMLLLEFL